MSDDGEETGRNGGGTTRRLSSEMCDACTGMRGIEANINGAKKTNLSFSSVLGRLGHLVRGKRMSDRFNTSLT